MTVEEKMIIAFNKDNRDEIAQHVIRCVKCAAELKHSEVLACTRHGVCPGCQGCWSEIEAEIENGVSVWPYDWYGHAWRDDEDSAWLVDAEAKP